MPSDEFSIVFDLPSLDYHLTIHITGVTADLLALIETRWPVFTSQTSITGNLDLQVTRTPVGLPSAELVTANVDWHGPTDANLVTNAASLAIHFEGGLVKGQGLVAARHIRAGLEAAIRAVTTLHLIQRGIFVLHASAVHVHQDAVLLLGPSEAGKTTTARRLGREGMQRIADDMVAIDLAASPPTLHALPFESAGRLVAQRSFAHPITCRAAMLVNKGATTALITDAVDPPHIWTDVLISLPPAPGYQGQFLLYFERLCQIPLCTFHVPPSGPVAPFVLRHLETILKQTKDLYVQTCAPHPDPARRHSMSDSSSSSGPSVERAANIAWRVLDGVAVLVAPSSPTVKTLNTVGTFVWQLSDGRTLVDIVDAVVNEFEVERTQASNDVEQFVRELEHQGLLLVKESH